MVARYTMLDTMFTLTDVVFLGLGHSGTGVLFFWTALITLLM
jgi:hypothetical protein